MQWSGEPHGGFTKSRPWLKVNPNYKEINVERDLASPDSIFVYYQELICLRKEHKVMVYGDYADQSVGDTHIYAYTRSYGLDTWLIVLNHSELQHSFQIPGPLKDKLKHAHVLLNNIDGQPETNEDDIKLRPYEAVIFSMTN